MIDRDGIHKFLSPPDSDFNLQQLAGWIDAQIALAVAEEREACAMACKAQADPWARSDYDHALELCISAIRARSTTTE